MATWTHEIIGNGQKVVNTIDVRNKKRISDKIITQITTQQILKKSRS